ncbi:hypothetical protein KSS87_023349, partial [Heliosperma pusillum]
MQNLTIVDVASNELSGTLPTSLFNISSLQVVEFGDNQLQGEIPKDIGFPVPRLQWLNLWGNNFSGSVPITIQNLTTLQLIDLNNNSFTGTVQYDFGNFYSLTDLAFEHNYLVGDINFITTLVNCSQLSALELGNNQFSEILPKYVANLSTSLKILNIQETLISGKIPEGITNLYNLELLALGTCKLTGSLPEDFGKLHKLQQIRLGYNRLGDDLFQGSASFVEVDLSDNHLEGSLPSKMSKQSNLETLRLSNNKFSGVIPDSLDGCPDLQNLFIDGNSFHGNIPSSFASLTSLQLIDFSRNNLSGPIPSFFSKFHNLYYLNLSYNNFEGMVPSDSVFANASAIFVVGNSRLCGGIKQLQLPKCTKNRSMERIKLIIPIISGLVGVVVLAAGVVGLYLACIKKKNTALFSGSIMGDVTKKVSYDMLLKATDGFSLENLLGTGSFGSVFKGVLDGRMVAVKVLNLQHHRASKSFMAECKTLRNVRHRNLIRIITACSSIDFKRNDFRALVYEFMPNGSLDRWLHGIDGNMSLAQRVDVAIDVAHALGYLHHECETPIVHCDLKPSNILLDNDMVAHVGDFGLARFLTQPRHLNQSSTIGIMGTIGYAAPEYGIGSEPSTEGDVYSYGVLLLELMTGKSPTDSMFNEGYTLHKHVDAALPDQILQIVDSSSLEEDNLSEDADDTRVIKDELQRRVECITTVMSIGVSCSKHLPQERMRIVDARSRLQSARDSLFNARNVI